MKYENKEDLKEKFVKMYLDGKTMQEISKLTNCSRNFIGNQIRNDERVIERRNHKIVKIYKNKVETRMKVPISVDFLSKIGIDKNCNKEDFVEVICDEEQKQIIIKKA